MITSWNEILVKDYTNSGTTWYGDRGMFVCGWVDGSGTQNLMQYITISTLSNSANFGGQACIRRQYICSACCSNGFIGLIFGGHNGTSAINNIDKFIFSANNNASAFGSLSAARYCYACCSDGVTAVTGYYTLEYVVFSTNSNTSAWGNLVVNRAIGNNGPTSVSSKTKGFFASGGSSQSSIEYITMSTQSNGISFGNFAASRIRYAGCSNETRGIFEGSGYIEYITMDTLSNASNFGNRTIMSTTYDTGMSNGTRGVFGGGSAYHNIIDYVIISILSNAVDFGDLMFDMGYHGATSGN